MAASRTTGPPSIRDDGCVNAVMHAMPMHSSRQDTVGALVGVRGTRPFPVFVRADVPLAGGCTPWLPLTVPLAMKAHARLELAGAVDRLALDNAADAQVLLQSWFANWQCVDIGAEFAVREAARGPGVGAFFSGGLDSLHTAITHRDEITHLIFVRGFDIGAGDHVRARRVGRVIRRAAALLDMPVIEVVTNIRGLGDPTMAWDREFHGAALAAVAHSLATELHRVFVPGSWPVGKSPRWGSHPDLDHLWSSSAMEISHDAGQHTRVDKLRDLAAYPEILDLLRVCWRNSGDDLNCGSCEKCVRTKIALIAAGVPDACASLRGGVEADDLGSLGSSGTSRMFAAENLAALRMLPPDERRPDLVAALSAQVEGSPMLARRAPRPVDDALLMKAYPPPLR